MDVDGRAFPNADPPGLPVPAVHPCRWRSLQGPLVLPQGCAQLPVHRAGQDQAQDLIHRAPPLNKERWQGRHGQYPNPAGLLGDQNGLLHRH